MGRRTFLTFKACEQILIPLTQYEGGSYITVLFMSTGQAECSLLILFSHSQNSKYFWPLKFSIQRNTLSLHKEGNVKKVLN